MVVPSVIAELKAMSERLAEIQSELLAREGVNLNVVIHGVGAKQEVLIQGDVTGLVHIALWSLDRASTEVIGSHAHVDEYGIANVGSTPLVIARAKATGDASS